MTVGDAAEPLAHIRNFRMDFGDTTGIGNLSIEYCKKVSIAGTFRRKELAAK
jgi:hypothetical protein